MRDLGFSAPPIRNHSVGDAVTIAMDHTPSAISFALPELAGTGHRARKDPYTAPQYTFANRAQRQLWSMVWILLYRPSPRAAHAWRAWLLRRFGAKLGSHCHFYPSSRVWAPWNLRCEDIVIVADGAELYNPAPMVLMSHAIVSQGAFLCGATHDYDNPEFPVVSFPMRIGRYAWVAAHATVSPGVNLGDGAILGLASVATKDLEPWSIHAGVPARKIKDRKHVE